MARREIFIDAREIADKKEVNGEETNIPIEEYQQLLKAKGSEKLKEYIEFLGFDCELDVTKENTKYNKDFFLGDLVTIQDEQLDLLFNSRVMEADEVFQNDGKSIYVKVGKSIPTAFEKMKKEVKNVGTSFAVKGEKGDPGPPGDSANITKVSELENDAGYATSSQANYKE